MIPEVLAVAIHATWPVPGERWALKYGIEVDGPKRLRGDWRTCVGFQLVGYFGADALFLFSGISSFSFPGWYCNWQPSCASNSRMSWYRCPRQSHVWYKSHTSAQWNDAGTAVWDEKKYFMRTLRYRSGGRVRYTSEQREEQIWMNIWHQDNTKERRDEP